MFAHCRLAGRCRGAAPLAVLLAFTAAPSAAHGVTLKVTVNGTSQQAAVEPPFFDAANTFTVPNPGTGRPERVDTAVSIPASYWLQAIQQHNAYDGPVVVRIHRPSAGTACQLALNVEFRVEDDVLAVSASAFPRSVVLTGNVNPSLRDGRDLHEFDLVTEPCGTANPRLSLDVEHKTAQGIVGGGMLKEGLRHSINTRTEVPRHLRVTVSTPHPVSPPDRRSTDVRVTLDRLDESRVAPEYELQRLRWIAAPSGEVLGRGDQRVVTLILGELPTSTVARFTAAPVTRGAFTGTKYGLAAVTSTPLSRVLAEVDLPDESRRLGILVSGLPTDILGSVEILKTPDTDLYRTSFENNGPVREAHVWVPVAFDPQKDVRVDLAGVPARTFANVALCCSGAFRTLNLDVDTKNVDGTDGRLTAADVSVPTRGAQRAFRARVEGLTDAHTTAVKHGPLYPPYGWRPEPETGLSLSHYARQPVGTVIVDSYTSPRENTFVRIAPLPTAFTLCSRSRVARYERRCPSDALLRCPVHRRGTATSFSISANQEMDVLLRSVDMTLDRGGESTVDMRLKKFALDSLTHFDSADQHCLFFDSDGEPVTGFLESRSDDPDSLEPSNNDPDSEARFYVTDPARWWNRYARFDFAFLTYDLFTDGRAACGALRVHVNPDYVGVGEPRVIREALCRAPH